jgi:hypothetical protein
MCVCTCVRVCVCVRVSHTCSDHPAKHGQISGNDGRTHQIHHTIFVQAQPVCVVCVFVRVFVRVHECLCVCLCVRVCFRACMCQSSRQSLPRLIAIKQRHLRVVCVCMYVCVCMCVCVCAPVPHNVNACTTKRMPCMGTCTHTYTHKYTPSLLSLVS